MRLAVTITVSAIQQLLVLSQTGLTFTSVVGGGPVPSQRVAIVNGGQGGMAWSVSSATVSGGGWLSAAPSSGRSVAGAVAPAIEVSVNPAGLAPGDYYGQVQVSSSDAPNSPQPVTVVLNILPAGMNPGPVAQFRGGKDGAINALVGQVMKRTRGSANPSVAAELLRARLST